MVYCLEKQINTFVINVCALFYCFHCPPNTGYVGDLIVTYGNYNTTKT